MSVRIKLSVGIGMVCLVAAAAVNAVPDGGEVPSIENIPGHVAQAEKHVQRMHELVSIVMHDLQRASKEHQVTAVACMTDALEVMKGLIRLGEGSRLRLVEAAARQDAGDVEHEYIKVSIALNKTEELAGRAKGCGVASGPGGGGIDGQNTIVIKDIDPELASIIIEPLREVDVDYQPVPSASPFFLEED